MIMTQNITVTNISGVLFVQKNNPPENIDFYTTPDGCNTHELIFRLKGEVETEFDGEILHNKRFAVQYLPKGQGSKIYKVRTVETGECIDILFDTDIPLSEKAFCMELSSPIEAENLFRKICDIWQRKDVGYRCEAMSVLYKIMSLLEKSTESALINNSRYLKIKNAVEYLNANFCQTKPDYEYAAKLSNMSYSYFRRLFIECMGVSPAKYVVNKKIDYAKELLLSMHYNVSETADALGFKDVYYFSHTFKRITGSSPSEYFSNKK